MRLESCRLCGTEMEPEKQCSICHNYITFHCSKCGTSSDSQIHLHN